MESEKTKKVGGPHGYGKHTSGKVGFIPKLINIGEKAADMADKLLLSSSMLFKLFKPKIGLGSEMGDLVTLTSFVESVLTGTQVSLDEPQTYEEFATFLKLHVSSFTQFATFAKQYFLEPTTVLGLSDPGLEYTQSKDEESFIVNFNTLQTLAVTDPNVQASLDMIDEGLNKVEPFMPGEGGDLLNTIGSIRELTDGSFLDHKKEKHIKTEYTEALTELRAEDPIAENGIIPVSPKLWEMKDVAGEVYTLLCPPETSAGGFSLSNGHWLYTGTSMSIEFADDGVNNPTAWPSKDHFDLISNGIKTTDCFKLHITDSEGNTKSGGSVLFNHLYEQYFNVHITFRSFDEGNLSVGDPTKVGMIMKVLVNNGTEADPVWGVLDEEGCAVSHNLGHKNEKATFDVRCPVGDNVFLFPFFYYLSTNQTGLNFSRFMLGFETWLRYGQWRGNVATYKNISYYVAGVRKELPTQLTSFTDMFGMCQKTPSSDPNFGVTALWIDTIRRTAPWLGNLIRSLIAKCDTYPEIDIRAKYKGVFGEDFDLDLISDPINWVYSDINGTPNPLAGLTYVMKKKFFLMLKSDLIRFAKEGSISEEYMMKTSSMLRRKVILISEDTNLGKYDHDLVFRWVEGKGKPALDTPANNLLCGGRMGKDAKLYYGKVIAVSRSAESVILTWLNSYKGTKIMIDPGHLVNYAIKYGWKYSS